MNSYKAVGPWTLTDCGSGAYRCLVGSDGRNDIASRVAFIEKTPRVRIRPWSSVTQPFGISDGYNWAEAPFKGDGPEDSESRRWCDSMLILLGYNF